MGETHDIRRDVEPTSNKNLLQVADAINSGIDSMISTSTPIINVILKMLV